MRIQCDQEDYCKGFVILQNTYDDVRVLGENSKHKVWFNNDELLDFYAKLMKVWEESLKKLPCLQTPRIIEIYVPSTILSYEDNRS